MAWRRNTSAAPNRQNIVITMASLPHGAGVHVTWSKTTSAAPSKDAIDTKRVTASVSPQQARAMSVMIGTSATATPAPVATPLPPRKPR